MEPVRRAAEKAALAIEDIKAAELYISLKTPEIADGNNFGVDVQASPRDNTHAFSRTRARRNHFDTRLDYQTIRLDPRPFERTHAPASTRQRMGARHPGL